MTPTKPEQPAETAAEWLTIPEVAKLLRFTSEQTAYRLAQRGELPGAKKFGGVWRVKRSELEDSGSAKPSKAERPARGAPSAVHVGGEPSAWAKG